MTIDIRAAVTCNLGPLISGTISDDYIQGNGLIKTKGSCELDGIFTPKSGDEVTFSYTRDGVTKKVPRKLRVLSSFADPFRKTTKVELGCKLTWMASVSPAPSVDGESAETSGRQQQCLNGYTDYPAGSKVAIPVSASGVMKTCLQKLGIAAASNPLTNQFYVDKFDLSQGYVTVLSDLLLSEGYLGYLDDAEILQVVDLSKDGGKGPTVDRNSLIDLGPIGIGELPGDAALVRYNALQLKKNDESSAVPPLTDKLRNWEEEESISDPETHVVRYSDSSGNSLEASYSYVPYSKTVTEYGKDESWDSATCILVGREGADLSNSPIKRTTTERVLMAQAAANYCSAVLSAGGTVNPALTAESKKEAIYEYDDKGEMVKSTEETWEPFFKWAGGLDLEFVYSTATGTDYVTLGSDLVLVERVVTVYENIYADRPTIVFLKPGEKFERQVLGQKVSTQTFQNWAITQQGQQAVSTYKEQAPFASAGACASWLVANSRTLVLVDSQVRTNRGRDLVAGQIRPAQAARSAEENGNRSETVAKIAYVTGGTSSQRFVSFSMPYQADDYYSPAGFIVSGGAAGKALRYGRIQNQLLLGNRNGVSVQVPAAKMPAAPFDPVYLSDGSLSVQYRANAASWAFSRDGIVASLDALFWGVAGGTGTAWVPVAPGVTTFPPLPAVDADGNSAVAAVVPPWLESAELEGVTRTTAIVAVSGYLHAAVTEAVELVTKTKYLIGTGLAAAGRTFQATGYPAGYKFTKGIAAEAGSFALTGQGADNLGFYVVKADAGSFEIKGVAAKLTRTYLNLQADAGSLTVSGIDALLNVSVDRFADLGSFTYQGLPASFLRGYVLNGEAASLGVTGQAAASKVPDPYGANVSLLLHMNGADDGVAFTDSSLNNHVVSARNSARTKTDVVKYGSASGGFGGSGSAVWANAHPTFNFGANPFTIEFWTYLNSRAAPIGFGSQSTASGTGTAWVLSWATSSQIQFAYSFDGSTQLQKAVTWSPVVSTWYHLAVTRDAAGMLRIFVDGAQLLSTDITTAALHNSTAPLVFGCRYSTWLNSLNGYLDDVRITNGVARYTAAFTRPGAELQDP